MIRKYNQYNIGGTKNNQARQMLGPFNNPNNPNQINTASADWVRRLRACTYPQLKTFAKFESLNIVYGENANMDFLRRTYLYAEKVTPEIESMVLKAYEEAPNDSELDITLEQLDFITIGEITYDKDSGEFKQGTYKLTKYMYNKYWQWRKSGSVMLKPITFNSIDSKGNMRTVQSYNIKKFNSAARVTSVQKNE